MTIVQEMKKWKEYNTSYHVQYKHTLFVLHILYILKTDNDILNDILKMIYKKLYGEMYVLVFT